MKQQATFPPEDQTPDSGEPILFTQAKSLRDSVNGATVNGAKAFRGRGRGLWPEPDISVLGPNLTISAG